MKLNKIYGFTLSLTLLWAAGTVAPFLYQFPDGVETRWTSPENPGGKKSKAASENAP